jgi:hypothetical protein
VTLENHLERVRVCIAHELHELLVGQASGRSLDWAAGSRKRDINGNTACGDSRINPVLVGEAI